MHEKPNQKANEFEIKNVQEKIQEKEQGEESASFSVAEKITKIDSEIENREKELEANMNQISSVREELGISNENPEEDPSAKQELERIDQLKKEKEDLEKEGGGSVDHDPVSVEKAEEEKKLFNKALKDYLLDVRSSANVMLNALHERQEQGLNPLQTEDAFGAIVHHLKELEDLSNFTDSPDTEKISENISKIALHLEESVPPRQQAMREDPENLDKLIFGIKKFTGEAQEIGRRLPTEMIDKELEDSSKQIRQSFQHLNDGADQFLNQVHRKRSFF